MFLEGTFSKDSLIISEHSDGFKSSRFSNGFDQLG